MKIVVMLIWMGGGYGGPATIQGFNSLVTCEVAKREIRRGFEEIRPWFTGTDLTCVEVDR